MGTRKLTGTLGLPAEAQTPVATYLSTLDVALPLPRRERARILAEAADTLACEIENSVAAGDSPASAAQEAVAGFGTPAMLARQFAAAIAPGVSRRTGLALIASGPLVGLTWVAAAGHGPDWQTRIESVMQLMPVLLALLVVTVMCAAGAVATARIGTRAGLPASWPTRAAQIATLGCAAADAFLIAAATAEAVTTDRPGGMAMVLAVLFSAVRLTVAAIAWRRLSRLRVAAY